MDPVYVVMAYPDEDIAWTLAVTNTKRAAYSAIRDFIKRRIEAGIYTAKDAPLPPLDREGVSWSISGYTFDIEFWEVSDELED